ncbi:hypothetical protein [uncultured Phocaeicola sp.]|jgi:hypothetical protein|uniref:hypothetical protein n=1 Tax=uncultured Phocaeicola sp. TaxID=990718 RepID=UPI0015AFEADD|nr:hypothetical protein [uncultured Phocaeicola sp.]
MRYTRFLCFFLMSVLAVSAFSKKPKDKNKYGVYLAGVSASFTDSLVYFTDIQRVDSAALDEKGLLVGRSQYSLQLKDYLEQHEEGTNRTCFMFFNTKKKKLEKEIHKLKVKYQKGNTLVLKDLGSSFRFEKAVVE